jgi:hypothetical protein
MGGRLLTKAELPLHRMNVQPIASHPIAVYLLQHVCRSLRQHAQTLTASLSSSFPQLAEESLTRKSSAG